MHRLIGKEVWLLNYFCVLFFFLLLSILDHDGSFQRHLCELYYINLRCKFFYFSLKELAKVDNTTRRILCSLKAHTHGFRTRIEFERIDESTAQRHQHCFTSRIPRIQMCPAHLQISNWTCTCLAAPFQREGRTTKKCRKWGHPTPIRTDRAQHFASPRNVTKTAKEPPTDSSIPNNAEKLIAGSKPSSRKPANRQLGRRIINSSTSARERYTHLFSRTLKQRSTRLHWKSPAFPRARCSLSLSLQRPRIYTHEPEVKKIRCSACARRDNVENQPWMGRLAYTRVARESEWRRPRLFDATRRDLRSVRADFIRSP